MSTNINSDMPIYVNDFLSYFANIKGHSQATVRQYTYDIRLFLSFIIKHKGLQCQLKEIDIEVIKTISLSDLYSFMTYLSHERNNKAQTRAKKTTSIKSFFKYLCTKAKLIEINVARELECPQMRKSIPIYLTLAECKKLLVIANKTSNPERDYCIVTLFLNCGIRLSELIGINLSNISGGILSVIGKGNRERILPLNNACLVALERYIQIRPLTDEKALFLSERKSRISKSAVQEIVKKLIFGLGYDEKISAHKLRHTCATLMLGVGINIRDIQEVLGHKSIKTTWIYTHVYDETLNNAMQSNPLAEQKCEFMQKEPKKGRKK